VQNDGLSVVNANRRERDLWIVIIFDDILETCGHRIARNLRSDSLIWIWLGFLAILERGQTPWSGGIVRMNVAAQEFEREPTMSAMLPSNPLRLSLAGPPAGIGPIRCPR
jgi:hypothetical protein